MAQDRAGAPGGGSGGSGGKQREQAALADAHATALRCRPHLLPPPLPSCLQPKYLLRWVDLAAVWHKHNSKRGNLRQSVEAAGLTWQGRAHSAIDDARNTAR